MMKLILCTLGLMLLPVMATAQIDEKKKEKALSEVNLLGATAHFTEINSLNGTFDDYVAVSIARDMMEKEGIFGVELMHEGKTLRVYHMSYIDVEGLKSFVLPYLDSFHVEERVDFDF